MSKLYTLLDKHGFYQVPYKGLLGGHRGTKIYGRLDCPSALRAVAKGGYVKHRVFFVTEENAIEAGYRPCAVCMKNEYKHWKETHETTRLRNTKE